MRTHPVSHKARNVATIAPRVPATTISGGLNTVIEDRLYHTRRPYLPEPIPEIELRRVAHYWAIVIGHVIRSTPFFETADPFRVCKWIKAWTQGPVNIVVNL